MQNQQKPNTWQAKNADDDSVEPVDAKGNTDKPAKSIDGKEQNETDERIRQNPKDPANRLSQDCNAEKDGNADEGNGAKRF